MDRTVPYPGIPELLGKLKAQGVRMAVYSNKADEFSRVLVEHYFPQMFDHIQGKLPGVPDKPDPTGVRQVMAALHASPASTLYVGDGDTDMETAVNAGLTPCGVTWGFRSRETLIAAGADSLVDTAQELAEKILG